MHNFSPLGLGTVNITATTTTGNVALNRPTAPMGADVRLYNAGAVAVFVMFGASDVAATTGNMPLAPGSVEVFALPPSATHLAAITATGTATVYATAGVGL
jgi:hypothetical protein